MNKGKTSFGGQLLDALKHELMGFSKEEYARIAALEDEASPKIDQTLSGLSESQLKQLLDLTRVRRGLISTHAAYDNEVVAISKQILSFGAAGLAITAVFSRHIADVPPPFLKLLGILSLFYLNLVMLSLFTLFCFLWLTRFRYPFLYLNQIGNALPFFYYKAISGATPRFLFQSAYNKIKGAELYAKDLETFLAYHANSLYSSASDYAATNGATGSPDEADLGGLRRVVRDEFQQYFLLVSYQGYVNQFEVKLNNNFIYGLVASVIASVVVSLVSFAI